MQDPVTKFRGLLKRLFPRSPVASGPDGEFERKYRAFRDLLEQNNRVLELMADMEEKRSGEFLFDRRYVESRLDAVTEGVGRIIESLDLLSGGRYPLLEERHQEIRKKIEEALAHAVGMPASVICIPLSGLSAGMAQTAGGKMAGLGEVRNQLGLPVPDGFSITAHAFRLFLEHNALASRIRGLLQEADGIDLENIQRMSAAVQDLIRRAEVPPEVRSAVLRATEELAAGHAGPLMTAVRSSAVLEDGVLSFAGQYATFLNIPADLVLETYQEVLASLFSPRAIFYYKTKGLAEDELSMAVGVLRMVPSVSGGVLYTRDPRDPDLDRAIVNAVPGLGLAAVDGTVQPESLLLSRADGTVQERAAARPDRMYVCRPEGGIAVAPAGASDAVCLSDAQLRELLRVGMLLEGHYGGPQDIEWAVDQNGSVIILQSRPLRLLPRDRPAQAVPRRISGRTILLDRGVIACKGIGFGRAYVLRSEEDLKDFPDGGVLVARHTSTRFVSVMTRAAAIVTDVGGVAGHMASLAREYQVPALVDAGIATAVIRQGQEVTVDAVNGTVYAGLVEELRPHAGRKKDPLTDTRLFRSLEQALRWVVPLNLLDPDAPDFHPESCRTFHDITRFCHEKAMAEMFSLGDAYDGRSRTIALRAGIPVQAHLYDIAGGVTPGARVAGPEQVLSLPFSAFLQGMRSMRWPEPRPADVKGFLGMIAHTAEMSEEELRRTAEKSFAVLSGNYMNFSIRLGYHFSQVEAFTGECLNDNYVRFFFSGGGAVRDRRLRRVRLIREVLALLDFHVKVAEDVLRAELLKYRTPEIRARLEVMGKLTAYTKQLDMALFNDPITDWYIEEFVREHVTLRTDLRPGSAAAP